MKTSTGVVTIHQHQHQRILFRIIPISLHANGKTVNTFAFLDGGSDSTLLENSIAKKLGVTGPVFPLCMQWTNGVKRTEENSQRLQLEISGTSSNKRFLLNGVHTVSSLDLPHQTIDFREMQAKFPHLKGLPVSSYEDAVPGLLIGLDNTRMKTPLKLREGKGDEPVAAKTRLGWTLYGRSGNANADLFHQVMHVCNRPTNNELHEMVKNFFTVEGTADYLAKGYAHKATELELKETKASDVWYLPLGVVTNPKKPEKLRIVWDAAASVKGVSLNSVLLKGPDLLQSLPTVLCRFRQKEVAINADIKEMFHQVLIRPEDRQALRFLWRNQPSEAVQVFVMNVAIFGSTCSPCSAQFVKDLNASEHSTEFPRAATAVIENHYVDDYLDSVDTVEEAVQLAEEVKTIHERGGFELRHWLSNAPEVLERIGEESSESSKNFVMGKCTNSERILGMIWIPQEDIFSFAVQFRSDLKKLVDGNGYPTKRELLSLVMSIFDPLGLVANFVIHGKVLVQDVWRSGIEWDETIPEAIYPMWNRKIFWSDSNTVLAWLRSDQHKFHQFVAFRVGEILEQSEASDWRKVPTRWNVSDEATKWGNGPVASETCRWQRGPEFLYKDERDWPEQEKNWVTSEEMRIVNLHHRTGTEEIFKFERFSKWERLLRTAAYVRRFRYNCQKKKNELTLPDPEILNREELLEAELTVVRLIQRESFANEYATLVFNQQVPMEQRKLIDKNSKLYKLCPFLGGDGVIRKDGRIGAAPWLSYEAKFPAILPKNHYVTTLIIHSYHRKFGHANNETVVNELRQRFHVSEIRSAVRKMSDNCRKCKVRKASPHPPRMGPLPESRLNPYVRPFTFTGLDYFGPISIRLGRSCVKRWVALFTCLTALVVATELAFTLATESCKLAVRRFISRRGAPLEIYSDQGTNFQGARKELQQEINKLNHELAATFTNAATQWNLNPPYAPHMGGIWERLVRSVKAALTAMEMSRNPDEETLITALAEAESLINSRPLTYLPLDSEENEACSRITRQLFVQIGSMYRSCSIGSGAGGSRSSFQ
ncbi:uncharacterized protein LOC129779676 [Toxorhynchites rutilus septentrionalis]|uniref:uncharacterized protein LOC129779676 n=1 Tax=Toxorhynchites rutilus septentrionalis TaxID=329112 RepID=UPI002479E4B2|nr:uncharacterized protein LOC129779676 [Toxorhynchites rutilus septentrionalis]